MSFLLVCSQFFLIPNRHNWTKWDEIPQRTLVAHKGDRIGSANDRWRRLVNVMLLLAGWLFICALSAKEVARDDSFLLRFLLRCKPGIAQHSPSTMSCATLSETECCEMRQNVYFVEFIGKLFSFGRAVKICERFLFEINCFGKYYWWTQYFLDVPVVFFMI